MADRQPALVTPFWVRIATETSLSPGWLLVAFPAVLYPLYLLLEAMFGRGLTAATDLVGDWEARVFPFWAFMLGYVAMCLVYIARGTGRDLKALRPVLEGGDAAYASFRDQLTRFDRRRLWIGGLVLLAIGCVQAELAVGRWTRLLTGEGSFRDLCVLAMVFAIWTTGGRGLLYLIDSARLYSKIGEQHVEVDLLDLSPLSPLTRHGLRIVLLGAIYIAVVVIFATAGVQPATGQLTTAGLVACFLFVLVATAAFLLPVRGLRRHIRAHKAEELARVREEIRIDHELAAQRGPESAGASARMPGLLAYKHEIESVREWPFDAPTLTRFFLYVAIPLGSWVGGALVERLLGAALD